MLRLLFLLSSLFIWSQSFAQPPNDSIQNRIPLILDQRVTSSTVDATVQWNCVDEELTGQCIEYHNDQWYSFIPSDSASVYLTISQQRCRDIRGIQVVIFTGEPCQPQTYTPWVCYSTGTQEDVFIALDSLIPGKEYLIGVDGYLQDYCSFEIAMASQPKGLPAKPLNQETTIPPVVVDSLVVLRWYFPSPYSVEYHEFMITRRNENHGVPELTTFVPVRAYALGSVDREYWMVDTVHARGKYRYQVWAMPSQGSPLLLGQHAVRKSISRAGWEVLLYYPRQAAVQIKLYNAITKELLREEHVSLDAGAAVWRFPRVVDHPLHLQVTDMQGELLDEYYKR